MYRSAILFKKQPLGQTPEKKKSQTQLFPELTVVNDFMVLQ